MQLNSVSITPQNTGGLRAVWLQGYSRARIRFRETDVTLQPGETVTGYSVTLGGSTYTVNTYGYVTTDPLEPGDNTLVCTVHGANGESASLTQSISVYPYTPPTASYTVLRCDSLGQENTEGGYLKLTALCSGADAGGANSFTTAVQIKSRSQNSYTPAGSVSGSASLIFGGSYTSDHSYDIKLTLSDTVGNTAEYSLTVPSDFWALRFSSDGHGMSLGKPTATSGYLELASGMTLRLGSTDLTEADLIRLLRLL